MKFHLEAACGSNVGKIRQNNEDNLYFDGETLTLEHDGSVAFRHGTFGKLPVCFGVFDGMGGVEDGQVASFLAARSFAADCGGLDAGQPLTEAFFENAVTRMNESVCVEADVRGNHMGTTAVMAGFSGNRVYICSVGDSRAYRLRGGRLTQISVDHVEKLPPAPANMRRRKPRLTQCIGIPADELRLEPFLFSDSPKKGDVYLLCSDGLTDLVPDFELRLLLTGKGDVRTKAEILINRALAVGGRDNITLVLIQVLTD